MASSIADVGNQITKALSQMLEEELPKLLHVLRNFSVSLNNNFEQDGEVPNQELTPIGQKGKN